MNIQKEVIELTEDINDIFGCDAMYYGIDSLHIANELIKKGYVKTKEDKENDFIMKRFMRLE